MSVGEVVASQMGKQTVSSLIVGRLIPILLGLSILVRGLDCRRRVGFCGCVCFSCVH